MTTSEHEAMVRDMATGAGAESIGRRLGGPVLGITYSGETVDAADDEAAALVAAIESAVCLPVEVCESGARGGAGGFWSTLYIGGRLIPAVAS